MEKLFKTLLFLTIFSLPILSRPFASADSSGAVRVRVDVPVTCTLESSQQTLTATIYPNSSTTLDPSNLQAICNDGNGLAVYAIGYSNDTYSNTNLISSNSSISTGIASSPSASQWNMSVARTAGIANNLLATISDGTNGTENFVSPHVIPSAYTKIASYPSATDATVGVNISTSYTVYIAPNQAAGDYQGKVKFTIVHPANHAAPETPICAANAICYFGNGADEGTMGQHASATETPFSGGDTVRLRASNFSRANYGFIGWSTQESNPNTIYGPQQAIELPSDMSQGLILYATWKQKESGVTMQTFDDTAEPYASAAEGTIIALEDIRDHEVYAVAKLSDEKWWMIENLRLDYDANITTSNTQSNNGSFGGAFTGLAEPEDASLFSYSSNGFTNANSLYNTSIITGTNQGFRFPRYNNDNTASRTINPTSEGLNIYSYGNFYNWAAAIADTSDYSYTLNASYNTTSICPSNWHLPVGGNNGEFVQLVNSMSGTPIETVRSYPYNFIGFFTNGNGAYQTTTNCSNTTQCQFTLYINSNTSTLSAAYQGYNKNYKAAIRCIAN